MKSEYLIKVTVLLEQSFWVGIFERNDPDGYAVARHIFGAEPSDPELYEFVTTHFYELKFTAPLKNIKLIIKRKNFKRANREARKEVKTKVTKKESLAQEALRIELEKRKKTRKTVSKAEKAARGKEQFLLRQAKKKKKQRGH